MQNCDAAGCQHSVSTSEASNSQPSLVSESSRLPAAENTQPGAASVPLSMPEATSVSLPQLDATSAVGNVSPVFPQLTYIATQLEEFLNSLAVCGEDGVTSCRQDAVRNLLSAAATDVAMSASRDSFISSTAETLCDRMMKELRDLKTKAEALTVRSMAKQWTSGSDSGHDDSSSLPPDVSADTVNGHMDTDVMQQHLTDANGCSNEAAVSTTLNSKCQKTADLVNHVNNTLKPSLGVVQPCKSTVAVKVPEFVAQGNLIPSWQCSFIALLEIVE